MSDISNAAQNTPVRADEAPDVSVDADDQQVAATRSAGGKGRFIAAAAAAVALGVAWIAYRFAKASVKRHPAVQVTRAGVHAVRGR